VQAIGTFLVLTFGVTWALWALVLRVVSAAHEPSHVPRLLALGGPVFLIGVFAPGLVAVALTAWDEGGRAVGALLRRILRWRVGLRFYAFALLLMPLTKLTVAIVHRALVGAWPQFGETRPLLLVLATILSTIGQAGEEVGWRGYLLPRLTERTGLVAASLVVGAIWAAWHLPLFFAPGADTNGQSFPLYALQVTAYSVALAWLYWRTGGSLLLTMFMHAAFNNMKDIVPSGGIRGGSLFTLDATLVFRLTVVLLWAVGVLLLIRMRGVWRVDNLLDRRDSLPAA
jgi:membrane protease YdiL (CAAX protease family)